MDAPRQYLKELRGELSLYPTWLPGEPIELGAFGTIKRGSFVPDGRLRDLGIGIVAKRHNAKLDVKRSRGIKLHGAAGLAVPGAVQHAAISGAPRGKPNASSSLDAEQGVDVEFERAYAWAFAARGMTKVEIDNIDEVQREVLAALRARKWERQWLIVTDVRHAEHLNVLISRSRGAKGRLHATGSLSEPLDILLLETSFELSSVDVFQVRNVRHATPLYGLRKLRGFLDPRVRAIQGGDTDGTQAEFEADETLEQANDEPLFGPNESP
jgi:hypothetical protein